MIQSSVTDTFPHEEQELGPEDGIVHDIIHLLKTSSVWCGGVRGGCSFFLLLFGVFGYLDARAMTKAESCNFLSCSNNQHEAEVNQSHEGAWSRLVSSPWP